MLKTDTLRLVWANLAQRRPAGRAVTGLQAFAARKNLGAAAAVVATIAIAVAILGKGGGSPADQPYLTQQAFLGDLDVRVSASGTVEPARIIDVSTELSGTVKAVHVDYNDQVKAGQLLAELDSATWLTQLARARSSYVLAEARLREGQVNLAQADSDLERKRRLADRRATSDRELEIAAAAASKAAAAVDMLSAELAIAAADVSLAESNLGKTRIVSPIDGVVLRRSVEPGQAIAASLQSPVLFRIALTLDDMQVKVDVDEADALAVQSGQAASFKGQALRNHAIPATVRKIYLGPEIVQGVVTYKAILGFDNAVLQLKPGMTATADVSVAQRREVLLVPNAAFRFAPPSQAPEAAGQAGLMAQLIGVAASAEAPMSTTSASAPEAQGATADMRRLHKLSHGVAVPVQVRIGQTDGTHTEIVAGDLVAGDAVILDLEDAAR
jgi:HlyD family secretion protein